MRVKARGRTRSSSNFWLASCRLFPPSSTPLHFPTCSKLRSRPGLCDRPACRTCRGVPIHARGAAGSEPPDYAPPSGQSERTSRKIVEVSGQAVLDGTRARAQWQVDANPGRWDATWTPGVGLMRCWGVEGREMEAECSFEG